MHVRRLSYRPAQHKERNVLGISIAATDFGTWYIKQLGIERLIQVL